MSSIKNRVYYFGFDSAMDHPEWQNCVTTSLVPNRVQTYYELNYKNPFRPRLRRILKEFDKNVNIGFDQHTIFVEKGKAIRPLITKVATALMKAGWKLGDFNRNTRVDDLYNEWAPKTNTTR